MNSTVKWVIVIVVLAVLGYLVYAMGNKAPTEEVVPEDVVSGDVVEEAGAVQGAATEVEVGADAEAGAAQ